MGAFEDTNMLEQDVWLLLPQCVLFFFNSVKKEKVIAYLLMPFFLGIFKNAHVTFVKLRP